MPCLFWTPLTTRIMLARRQDPNSSSWSLLASIHSCSQSKTIMNSFFSWRCVRNSIGFLMRWHQRNGLRQWRNTIIDWSKRLVQQSLERILLPCFTSWARWRWDWLNESLGMTSNIRIICSLSYHLLTQHICSQTKLWSILVTPLLYCQPYQGQYHNWQKDKHIDICLAQISYIPATHQPCKVPICSCCKTIMYLDPKKSATNHKCGICADGARSKPIPEMPKLSHWPQPYGIFSDGTIFHPLACLKIVQKVYEIIVSGLTTGLSMLLIEIQAFMLMLEMHLIISMNTDGNPTVALS